MSEGSERRIDKPWGFEIVWAETPQYVGKILHIFGGQALSLQYHRVKDETLRVLSGRMQLVTFLDGEAPQERVLGPGEIAHIAPGLRHRMTALEETELVEVSTPELDDVVRLDDRYGRVE